MHRVFIAINLPENVKSVLQDILENLRKLYRGAPMRFVKADGFHITLHFLGNQDDAQIAAVSNILDKICARYKKTKLTLSRFGFFPNEERPRVLWLGGEEAENRTIESLQKDLGRELQKLRIKVATREWRPHITFGRISGEINTSMLRSMEVPFMEWGIDSLELMESDLKPQGAEYKVLYTAKLDH